MYGLVHFSFRVPGGANKATGLEPLPIFFGEIDDV